MSGVETPGSFLEVGTAAVISTRAGEKEALRFKTVVRGWTNNACIIVDTPDASPFRRYQPCVVRFVNNGQACGFDSVVIDVATTPRPYLYLQWPSEVEVIRMRRHERLGTCLPCTIAIEGGDQIHGMVRDLSAGGCCFQAKVGIRVEEAVNLSFALPHGQLVENVSCQLRNVRPQGKEALYGCEFVDLPTMAKDHIEFYITTRLDQLRSGQFSKSHILIADSDVERVWPLHEAIETDGRYAFIAKGVVDIFYRLRFVPPALLIMSHDQPEASAAHLCRIIRSVPSFATLPIVVYGGDACTAGEEVAAAGANLHLPDISDTTLVTKTIQELTG